MAAVDINPQANLVYKHNFPKTKLMNKTIEVFFLVYLNPYCVDQNDFFFFKKGIKIDDFNSMNFDMILMSILYFNFKMYSNLENLID